MAAPKRLRARRARAHWREKRSHDLTSQYREGDLPSSAHLAVVEVEDAFAPAGRIDKFGELHVEAELAPVRHSDGTLSEGAPAWHPPRRPTARVVVSLRGDPIGKMFARHQIDEAQYKAARSFQQLFDRATIGGVAVADLLRPKVDGGRIPDPLSAGRMAATKQLHNAERTITDRHGFVGLSLIRCVLTGGKSLDKAARDFGALSTLERRWWGGLLRRCLDVLAQTLGFATSAKRPRQLRGVQSDSAPEPDDPRLHADVADLTDASLRHGRTNGRGH
jgi:hypothetical protein